MEEPLDSWFKREVLTHEPILMRFLARAWPRLDEVPDIRQEAYARVYEAALKTRPSQPKAFLFTTARHLMADRVRRERVVSIRASGDQEFPNVLVDEISPEREAEAHEELARLARAFDRLSDKCRQVVWLRRVRELSQKEVAERLGLSEKTVEKHLRTGARLLAHYTRASILMPREALFAGGDLTPLPGLPGRGDALGVRFARGIGLEDQSDGTVQRDGEDDQVQRSDGLKP